MTEPLKFIDRDTGKEIEVNPEGNLGLLALGDVAVKPWRQKRIESGYEAELKERLLKQKEEAVKLREEMKKKRQEHLAKKKEQEQNGETKS